MADLIFLDTETTGLDPDKHEVWEVAFAYGDGPAQSYILPHSLDMADPKALELNGYWERANKGFEPKWGENWDLTLRTLLTGNTLVCANPTFDRMFLRARWGYEPWHYRSVDVESMAFAILGYDIPKGLAAIRLELISLGYDITLPDHSAVSDVLALRDCFRALRTEKIKRIQLV